ncbi:putative tellurite resistance protein B-like protein [Hoeflea marina]|uniref:Putative tellurite resistance protein B-like protein n=1 Tax=Hoeflea marina TaxID=274592 RepID=A0A317PHW3_9HYPH|nr:TerB family tellurite resistance protein [Hoeflea marina]PWV98980.1 putative tellurite resistance protein B-like protein [Hoeflea marina]
MQQEATELSNLVKVLAERFRRKPVRSPAIERLAGDPVAMAQMLLLFRVVLLDGVVRQEELNGFERVCRDRFDIGAEDLAAMHALLDSPEGRAVEAEKFELLRMLGRAERRQLLAAMISIAGGESAMNEDTQRLIGNTADLLGIDPDIEGISP